CPGYARGVRFLAGSALGSAAHFATVLCARPKIRQISFTCNTPCSNITRARRLTAGSSQRRVRPLSVTGNPRKALDVPVRDRQKNWSSPPLQCVQQDLVLHLLAL